MKRNFWILGLIATAFTLANCTKEIEQPQSEPEVNQGIPFEIVASTVETKTTNVGLITKWDADDNMSVVHAEAGSDEYSANDEFIVTAENLESNKFTGTLTEALDAEKSYDWYMMYPYSSSWTPNATSKGVVYIGSKYNEDQTQDGNSSKAHLAGTNFPLYGKAAKVKAGDTPNVNMSQLASVVEVKVVNKLENPLTVTDIAFTAPESIIGSYFIAINGDSPVYTPNGEYVSTTASLKVNDGTPIAQNISAKFYIGIKPFTAASGQTITISVNGYKKTLTLQEAKTVSFEAGHIKPMTFNYDRIPQTLSFSTTALTVAMGSDVTEPVLSGAKTTVTYKSSDETVATVGESGEISLIGAGTTTITATAAQNETYQSATASYTLTVTSDDTKYYTKVTSITGGKKYLLVAEYNGVSYIFEGSNVKVTTGAIQTTVTNDKIVSNDEIDANAVTFTSSGTGYTIMLGTQQYVELYKTSSSNSLRQSSNATVFNVTTQNGKFLLESSTLEGRCLIYRDGTGFKNYSKINATSNGYCGYLTLYELSE